MTSYSTQHSTAQGSTAQRSAVQHSTAQRSSRQVGGEGPLTHQGMGRDAEFKPGVAKKQDLGPKMIAKKTRLAKMNETRKQQCLDDQQHHPAHHTQA